MSFTESRATLASTSKDAPALGTTSTRANGYSTVPKLDITATKVLFEKVTAFQTLLKDIEVEGNQSIPLLEYIALG